MAFWRHINNVASKAAMVLGQQKLWSSPTHAQVEPTSRCNQDCVMCSRLEMLKKVGEADMTSDQFDRVLREMPQLIDLQLNGLGEPLMNPLTPEFIKRASLKGIKTSMNCNAAFITEKKAQELLDSGLNILKISMDGAEPELYRRIRRAEYTPVLKGIERICAARRERPGHPMRIWFNTVIQKENREHLLPIVELAALHGVDQVRFKVVGMFDLFDPKDLGVPQADIPVIARNLRDTIFAKDIKVKTNLHELIDHPERLFRRHEKHPCYSPFYEVYVQAYGGVRLCCEFYDSDSDIGNLYTHSMEEIWNGPKMLEIRRRYWEGDTFFKNCEGCNRFYWNEDKLAKIKKARGPLDAILKPLPEVTLKKRP